MYIVTIALQPYNDGTFEPWFLVVQKTQSYQESSQTSFNLDEDLRDKAIEYEVLKDTSVSGAQLITVTDSAVQRFNNLDRPSLTLELFAKDDSDLKSYGSFVFEIEDDEADAFLRQSLLCLLGWRGEGQIVPVLVHSTRPLERSLV